MNLRVDPEEHWTVYVEFTYRPKHPDLPDKPDYAILEFMDDGLITITNPDHLEKLVFLFENAEFLGYEPKTHSVGVGLNLILTSGAEDFVIELDPDSDICRINGELPPKPSGFWGFATQKVGFSRRAIPPSNTFLTERILNPGVDL